MSKIEELLQRRSDLSTFLVHLTRDTAESDSRTKLLSIARDLRLRAVTPFGPAAHLEPYLAGSPATQKVVCFTETPLEHTWMLVADIEDRSIQFAPYGLVITKTTARKGHCNPVWYTDISTRGGRDWPMKAINTLVDEAVTRSTSGTSLNSAKLRQEPIFKITPFIEQMGPMRDEGRRKEFWWEREWRHVDDYQFTPRRVVAVLAPEDQHDSLRSDLDSAHPRWERTQRPLLDPRWGLEHMIASLAGIDEDDIGPFPDAWA